jgi:radical SAM superfamily enzyme YgiQ (UPF0313 family)
MKNKTQNKKKNINREKILLGLLPFWTPQIPPLGISCLKSYLEKHGYNVKIIDANTKEEFKEMYINYFNTLKQYIPENKQGNYYSIGHDVLQNHMMAHFNHEDEKEYIELVKILVYKTFFCPLECHQVIELNNIITEIFRRLEKYFFDLLDREQPEILGLSVNGATLPASMFLFKRTREKYPTIKTVVGGGVFSDQLAVGTPNFEIFLEKTSSYIDKIIIGEGEILFLKLLQGELSKTQRIYSNKDINFEMLDLSSADIPDFSGLDLQHYPYLASYTSRSCLFQCRFCSDTVFWGKYRKKKAKKVVEELSYLYKKHGYQLFMMSDLLLNPIINDLANEFTNSDVVIYWDGCLRVDNQVGNPENTILWRRGGFYKTKLGIESGSPRMLKMMNKNISIEQIKKALTSLSYAGIQTTTFWVIGFPGETETDFQQTLDLIEEMRNDIYEAECRPFYYYLSGQAGSGEWGIGKESIPLYPENSKDMLLFQTWILDGEPSREETYQRVNRFVKHCDKLGIPNPYTLYELYEADQRWGNLHKNAVPSILEFKNKGVYIEECKNVGKLSHITGTPDDDKDFDF